MKTAVVYYSRHHANTKKLLDEIAKTHDLILIDVTDNPSTDLTEFDCIGFASGIYYSKFHKTLLKYAKENMPQNKKTFFIYTYGAEKSGYTAAIQETLKNKNTTILGEYGCLGFNTFGPFKLIGGIAKNHPNRNDLEKAVAFYENLK